MRILSSSAFREKLARAARGKRFPLRVMLELTYSCNFRCPHCYIPPGYRAAYKKRELSLARFRDIIDQLAAAGCLQLGFTGGEPLLKKGLFSLLRHAKSRGMETYLCTNASLITSAAAAELKRCCDKVDITIPAMSRAAFGKVTGVPRYHSKVFRAVKLLKNHGVPLGLKTCDLKANHRELQRIKAFASKVGAPWRVDTEHIPRLDGTPLPTELLCGAARPPAKRRSCPSCGAADSQAAITPAGEIKLCVAVDAPKWKIGPATIKMLWRRLGRARLKKGLLLRCPAL